MQIPKQITLKISTRPIMMVVFGVLVAAGIWLLWSHSASSAGKSLIAQIKTTGDLGKQTQLYKQLLDKEGAVKAQDDLLHSGLPFTGQTHLLNHEAGVWLYEKYGAAGLAQCTENFLASCYHGFVLDAIGDGGMPKVVEVMDKCRAEGPAVFPQCAHAVGHGLLAFVDYKNLPQALALCDQLKTQIPDMPSFSCYDGVFMENIWGIHNDGKPSPDRWVKDSDAFYPCDDPHFTNNKQYLLGCWSNQPSLMFQQYKGDIAHVGQNCLTLKDPDIQTMCFNGLSRQINPMANGSSDAVFRLCGLMPNSKWVNYCVVTNANAYYSVGDRNVPFQICGKAEEPAKTDCYNNLLGIIPYLAKSQSEAKSYCSKIVDTDWKDRCTQQVDQRFQQNQKAGA